MWRLLADVMAHCARVGLLIVVVHSQAMIAAEELTPEPPSFVDAIIEAANDDAKALELLDALPADLSSADLAKLRELDRQLSANSPAHRSVMARKLLTVLRRSGEVRSLVYLHEVFEAAPERRHYVAQEIAQFALTQRRRPEDWRLLVRATALVTGEPARDVLRALPVFHERGTKPQWQREVILAGLRLGSPDDREAVRVLRHWTGQTIDAGEDSEKALAAWQTWFDARYPELPPPTLPVEVENGRYRAAELVEFLSQWPEPGDPLSGAKAIEKALCLKCHRYGSRGEAMGPDLTNVRQRFQLQELVEAIVFPSQSLSDQYTTSIIITRSGQTFTGVTAAEGDDLVILQANGEKARVARYEIDEALPSRKSSMPDGLLEHLSRDEVADLFAYLRRAER